MKYESARGEKAVTGVCAITFTSPGCSNLISCSVVADSWIPHRKYLSGGLEWRRLFFFFFLNVRVDLVVFVFLVNLQQFWGGPSQDL